MVDSDTAEFAARNRIGRLHGILNAKEGGQEMKASTILFPTAFSHCGDAALEMATSLALDSQYAEVIQHAP